jgi:hypothetical protein
MGRVVQIQKARIKLAMRDFKRLHGILVIMTLHEGFDKQLYKNAERANRLISFIILAAKTHSNKLFIVTLPVPFVDKLITPSFVIIIATVFFLLSS